MKFLVDRMLGKLAKSLRALGYDTVYYRGEDPHELMEMARRHGRAVLTRNRNIFPGSPGDEIVTLQDSGSDLQVKALLAKGIISLDEARPFTRCLLCNALLDNIPKEAAEGKVPDYVFVHEKEFSRCPDCSRIYWRGSHHDSMQKWIEGLYGSC